MDTQASSSHCHDCGAPLTGRFCAACGQKDEARIVPLGHLLHEVFHDLVHLDARFFRTLGALLRPGLLTQEYLAGRRTRWFPPFRLYLLVSLLFFAVTALGPTATRFQITTPASRAASNPGTAVPQAPGSLTARIEARAAKINQDPAPFLAKLMSWLPRVVFLLLPLFALLLKLAYLRARILYAAHAIFSLHAHALIFLVFTATRILGYLPYLRSLRAVLLLALPVYLLMAMKRVYGQGWFLTGLKASLVGLLHLALTLLILAATTLALLVFGA